MTADTRETDQIARRYNEMMLGAPGKRPYRDWPEMGYEFSFIWFKPFVKVSSVRVTDYQPLTNANIRNPDGHPFEELEAIAMQEGEIWSREYVGKQLGFSIQEVESGMVSLWLGFQDKTNLDKVGLPLKDYMDQQNLIEPMDLIIYSFESQIVADLLHEIGLSKVHYFDFGLTHRPADIRTFDFDKLGAEQIPYGEFASEPSRSFFMQTGYNDFSIIIHGNEKLADAIRHHTKVEGFFCNEFTDESWFDTKHGHMIGEMKRIAPPEESRSRMGAC